VTVAPRRRARRHRRRTVRVLVAYASPDGTRRDYATTLGAGGLFLVTDAPLPEGSRLKLAFRLRDTGALHEVEGRVAWARPQLPGRTLPHAPGMGIEFTDRAAAARLARELDEDPPP